jgi:hypothetical protein
MDIALLAFPTVSASACAPYVHCNSNIPSPHKVTERRYPVEGYRDRSKRNRNDETNEEKQVEVPLQLVSQAMIEGNHLALEVNKLTM